MIKIFNIISKFLIAFVIIYPNFLIAEEISKINDEEVYKVLEEIIFDDWFGIYLSNNQLNNHKLGYMHIDGKIIENENNLKIFEISTESIFNFKSYESEYILKKNSVDQYEATPPFSFLLQAKTINSNGNLSYENTTLNDSKLKFITIDEEGNEEIKISDNFNYSLNEYLVNEYLLLEDKLEKGDIFYYRTISEDTYEITKNEVLDVESIILNGVKQKLYNIKSIDKLDSGELVESLLYANNKKIISFDLYSENSTINFRYENKNDAKDLSKILDLYVLNSIELDDKHHDKDIIDQINFYALVNHNAYVDNFIFKINGDYDNYFINEYINQEVYKISDNYFINLGLRENVIGETVNEAEFDKAKLYSEENKKLREFTKKIIGQEQTEFEKIQSIMSWIYDNMKRINKFKSISEPLEILKAGGGDCTEFSDLFVGMVKSIGIPAKAVSGYTFAETSFGGHQWAEVELEGKWMPIDPIQGVWADNSPYHIKMNEDEFTLIKNIKFELVEAKLNNGENIVIKEINLYDVKY